MKRTILSSAAAALAAAALSLAHLSCGGGGKGGPAQAGPIAVSGLALSRNTMTLAVGDATGTLVPAVFPRDAADRAVSWATSDPAVATVADGVVAPVGAGLATITATSRDGAKAAECSVEVVDAPIPAVGAYLDKNELALAEGGTGALALSFIPARATNQNVSWQSSDTAVATVDANGAITAKAEGAAEITAAYQVAEAGTNAPIYGGGGKVRAGQLTVSSATLKVAPKSQAVAATGVEMDLKALEISVGGSGLLFPTVLPANATNVNVSFSSGDPKVASVSSLGVVTGKGAGRATITVTTENGGFRDTCAVTVADAPISPAGVSLNKTALELGDMGEAERLVATVSPNSATDKSLYWFSSDSAVAAVNANGTVQARGRGAATVTAETQAGGFTAACAVTVRGPAVRPASVSLGKPALSLAAGSSEQLAYTILPSDATNKSVTWTSSNQNVATVSQSGLVAALAAGTATITIATQDGGKTATCNVTVTPRQVPVQDVYVVGEESGPDNASYTTLWKNGVPMRLCAEDSAAYSVFVTPAGDVYVAGDESGPNNATYATLWKNGVPTRLPGSDNSHAFSVSVAPSGDVYAAGVAYIDNVPTPVLWTNGVARSLPLYPGMSGWAGAGAGIVAVSVSGSGDVYVAGYTNGGDMGARSLLWKNSEPPIVISIGNWARSLYVSDGGDVYVTTGNDSSGYGPCLWINGVPHPLPQTSMYDMPTSIYVSGGDVYVSGTSDELRHVSFVTDSAYYSYGVGPKLLWKNGQGPTRIGNGSSISYRGDRKLFVSGSGDAYVVEMEQVGGISMATMWENGSPMYLGPGVATSVFVHNGMASPDDAADISLNKASTALAVGGTETLSAAISPAAANKNVMWHSSDASVATVGGNGLVTGVGQGTAIIYATTADGKRRASCAVTVGAVPVSRVGFLLTPSGSATLYLPIGGAETLGTVITPPDATDKSLVWTSSNPNVATVDGSGRVTGVGRGNATIRAATPDGAYGANRTVYVYPFIVTPNKSLVTLGIGGKETLVPSTAPSVADVEWRWVSTAPRIATVDANGVVTGIGGGSATIYATAYSRSIGFSFFWGHSVYVNTNAPAVPVTGVTLKTSVTVARWGNHDVEALLGLTIQPSDASRKNVSWSSSDISVASIYTDEWNGTYLHADNPGTTTITATTADGRKTATCVVTVSQ
jgi:uncharacterized protein YjdB